MECPCGSGVHFHCHNDSGSVHQICIVQLPYTSIHQCKHLIPKLNFKRRVSGMALHCSPLHTGQAFPASLRSLVATSSERWLPQHDVCWGSRSSSKETGQKKSCEGRSSKSNSFSGKGSWSGTRTVVSAMPIFPRLVSSPISLDLV